MKTTRSKYLPDFTLGRVRFSLALATGLVAIALSALPFMETIEKRLYDLRIRLAARSHAASDQLVIIAFDDESLERMEPVVGSWPWPRMLHAPLLEYCSMAEAIGVDMLLSERQWQYRETGDAMLIKTVRQLGSRIILASHFYDMPTDSPPSDEMDRMAITCGEPMAHDLARFSNVMVPFTDLLSACRGVGDVNVRRDRDGTVRSYQAVVCLGETAYPSLSLALLSTYLGIPANEVRLEADGTLNAAGRQLRLDPDGSFLIFPTANTVPIYSAVDVIDSFNAEGQGREPIIRRDAFEGKIVLVGATAFGLHDHEITPMGEAVPGVLVHAHALQNLLEGKRILVAPAWLAYLLIGLLALLPAIRRHDRPRRLLFIATGVLLIYLLAGAVCASYMRLMLPVTGPVNALLLSTMALGVAYWSEERSRRSYVEALDKAKQQFTDMLVHDLKNTLAPIMMSLSMMEDDDDSGDIRFWRKDFPEIVSTSSNRLMTQINALLDIRRMQEGKLQLDPGPVDLNDVLDAVARDYRVAAERTGLQLDVRSDLPRGAHVNVDTEVFVRIMSNLIWNGIKYAQQGTAIEVTASGDAYGEVEVLVRNQGKPIAESVQRHLFMAFVTGPPPDEDLKRIPSTGLGLTFCKLATEAHGGRIRLESPVPGSEGGVQVVLTLSRIGS